MAATLIFHDKRVEADGAIMELTIWNVPEPVQPAPHLLKYSLYFGYPGRRVIGFDNERGKGDHMHIEGTERPYAFINVEMLIADFFGAVDAWRAVNG